MVLWYYRKNYGSMEKTFVNYGKQLWYYGKNYGTIVNYSIFLLGIYQDEAFSKGIFLPLDFEINVNERFHTELFLVFI